MIRKLLPPLLFGIVGCAVLVSLGIWQVQRLEWKQGILAEIDTRILGGPIPLPATPDPEIDKYQPVEAHGLIQPEEILVQSSLKLVGPGFRVIAPFETDGRRILLDRGFIRLSDRDKIRTAVETTVTGNLHWPDEVDGFTPDPDVAGRMWFARDIPSMAEELGTEPILLVVRKTTESPIVVTPLPIDSAGIPNDHLQYAVTWFLLAIVWAGMSVYMMVGARRRNAKGQ